MPKKRAPRTHTKYRVKVGNTIKHGGITSRPLAKRAAEHKNTWPKSHVIKVGAKVTKKSALKWEKANGYS